MKKVMEIDLGDGYKLSINRGGRFGSGFTLWGDAAWIMDASCFSDDHEIRIGTKHARISKVSRCGYLSRLFIKCSAKRQPTRGMAARKPRPKLAKG
jgi:hypothetical protein